nr:hypothetical protein [Tanacetum cinerariifolium]
VTKDVPSLAQSPELVKTPRLFIRHPSPKSSISPPRVNAAKPSAVRAARANAANPSAISTARVNAAIPSTVSAARVKAAPVLTTAARTLRTVKPKFSKARPNITPYAVSKTKLPFSRPFIRHPSPKSSISPPRVNAAKPSAVRAARANAANPSAISAARANAANPSTVSAARVKAAVSAAKINVVSAARVKAAVSAANINAVKPSAVTADETSPILKSFITGLENQLSLKVKVIHNDNGTEFKNTDLNQFCGLKGIKREFSVPRTPQENGIAERKNRTFIEAARTMVLVTKPHNKTPYELLHGRTLSIGFMRPFGCHVTILNTLDPLGKFKGKVDKGFIVGYSVCSKAFRVFNSRTRIIQETLHVNFLENKPNVAGTGPTWLFAIDSLTRTMNYQTVTARNQTNSSAGFQDKFNAEKAGGEVNQQYVLFPVWSSGSTNPQNNEEDAPFDGNEHDFDATKPESEVIVSPSSNVQTRKQDDKTKKEAKGKSHVESLTGYRDLNAEFEDCSDNSNNEVNAVGSIVPTVGQNSLNSTNTFSAAGPSNTVVSPTSRKSSFIDASQLPDDPDMPELEDITYSDDEDVVGAEADFNNLKSSIPKEPKRVHQSLKDSSWIEAMQEELLQFKMQKVWVLVNLPHGKRAIDDIIFGATNKDLFNSFKKLMKDKFQMSSTGELTFFLGLQVKQKKDGIFISQDKYIAEILRKFGLNEGKLASTPIDTEKPLLKDPDGEDVDVHTYRLISWQCKKQTVVATSSTEAEYVATAIQKQTALGKDSSNLLMADNLPKIVWYSTHHVTLMKSWLVQKQTALGKDKSNPLRIDSLLKTIWSSIHHHLTIEVLTIPGKMTTGKEISNPFMAGGKVTSGLSALRLEDSNYKGGDAVAGSSFGSSSSSSSGSLSGLDSGMYPSESVVGEAAAGSGCSSAGKTSSSGGAGYSSVRNRGILGV